MSSSNPGAAVTTQNQQVAATGNLSNEWILLLTPGLTTTIPANSSAEISITVTGLLLNDFIEVNKLNHVAGLSVGNARVSSANTLAIQMVNSTAAGIALQAADQYLVSVERPMAQYVTNGLPTSIPT
jgi:hypothetical protein